MRQLESMLNVASRLVLAPALGLVLGLALGLVLGGFAPGYAQFGPPAPKEKPVETPSDKVESLKSKFIQMFTPQEGEASEPAYQEVEEKRGAGIPGQFDTVKVKKYNEGPAAKQIVQPGRPQLLSQPPLENPVIEAPKTSKENPPIQRTTLDNPNNPLGLAVAQKRLNETAAMIESKNIDQAKTTLEPLRAWLVETTESHIALYKALNNVPTARVQAELEKQVALDFAKMRDLSFFQMGKIHLAEKNYREGIKMLIEVIKSQPRSDIGLKAYDLLQEIGFTQKLQLVE